MGLLWHLTDRAATKEELPCVISMHTHKLISPFPVCVQVAKQSYLPLFPHIYVLASSPDIAGVMVVDERKDVGQGLEGSREAALCSTSCAGVVATHLPFYEVSIPMTNFILYETYVCRFFHD